MGHSVCRPAWQLGLFLKNTDRYKSGAGRPQAALSTAVASQAGCMQGRVKGSSSWSPGPLVFMALSLLLLLGKAEAPLQLVASIISKLHILLNRAEIKAPDVSINRCTASKLQQFVASSQQHAAASAQPQAGFVGKLQHKNVPLLLRLESSF